MYDFFCPLLFFLIFENILKLTHFHYVTCHEQLSTKKNNSNRQLKH